MGNAPLKWKEIKNASGTQPKSRHGHRAVCIKELMIIFGGGNEGIINGLNVFNTFSNQWYSPVTKGDVPPGRAAFGMEVVGTRIIVFGGMLEYGEYTDESYELQTTKWEWKALKPKPTIENLTPCPRIGHSFTLIDGKIYLFGGLTNLSYDPRRNQPRILNDLFTLSVQQPGKYVWEMPTTFGNMPSPRESHTTVAFHSKLTNKKYLVMYGGMNGTDRLGELYTLDTDSMFWTEYKDIPGPTPLPRSLHSATRIGNKLYIFGGWVPFTKDKIQMKKEQIWECTSTCACLNLDTFTWEKINSKSVKGDRPRGRAGHCAVGIYGRIYLFSGRDGFRKAWNNQVRICCKDLWYIEVEPPEAPPKLHLVRVTTHSLEMGWNSIPNAQHYLIEVQKIPELKTVSSGDGVKEKMTRETELQRILKASPKENANDDSKVKNTQKSPIKIENKIPAKPDIIKKKIPEEDDMDIEQQIDELNQKRAEVVSTKNTMEVDEKLFNGTPEILSPPKKSVNQLIKTNSTEDKQKIFSPPLSPVKQTVKSTQNQEPPQVPTNILSPPVKPTNQIIKLNPTGLLSLPKSNIVINPPKIVAPQKPVIIQQPPTSVAPTNRPIFIAGNQRPQFIRFVNPSSTGNTVVIKNPTAGVKLNPQILFKTAGGQLSFQRPSGNQVSSGTTQPSNNNVLNVVQSTATSTTPTSQIVRPAISSNTQPMSLATGIPITIGGKKVTLITPGGFGQMKNVKIVPPGSMSGFQTLTSNLVPLANANQPKTEPTRTVILGNHPPKPAAPESKQKIIMMPQRAPTSTPSQPKPVPQTQTQKEQDNVIEVDSDEYEVEWIDQMDGALDVTPDNKKKPKFVKMGLFGGTRINNISNGTADNAGRAQDDDIKNQIDGETIKKNEVKNRNDGDSSSTESGSEFETKSQAQQEKSAIESINPLDALASAALEASPITGTKKEVKKEDQWMTVGMFKTLQHNVANYIDYNDWNSDVVNNLNSNNIPDLTEFKRIALEPGQAYRFRICGINSCGRGEFSEPITFKTSTPGLPGAPSATKIMKTAEGAHLSWSTPANPRGEILEYSVYVAVKSRDAKSATSPVTFIRVYCGSKSECNIPNATILKAHVDTTGKPAIIFRVTARNENGYGSATQVRWLQDATKIDESAKRSNDIISPSQNIKRLKGGKE